MTTQITDLIKGVPDWNQTINENNAILANAIDDNTDKIGVLNTSLSDIEQQTSDIVDKSFFNEPIIPMPSRKGIIKNCFKLAFKYNTDAFRIVQKSNKGYVMHYLNTMNGDSSTSSIGTNWDLVRLKRSCYCIDAYNWLEPVASTGTLTTVEAPSILSSLENNLFRTSELGGDNSSVFSSKSNNYGLGIYSIAPSSQVDFTLNTTLNGLANILAVANANISNNVDILINGETIKNINARANRVNAGDGYAVLEFPVPVITNTQKTYTVTIKNNDTSRVFEFSCFNFFRLGVNPIFFT
jgi:hypothetical protein